MSRATPHKSIEIDQQAGDTLARYNKDISSYISGIKKEKCRTVHHEPEPFK
jgi:hypothetical protein